MSPWRNSQVLISILPNRIAFEANGSSHVLFSVHCAVDEEEDAANIAKNKNHDQIEFAISIIPKIDYQTAEEANENRRNCKQKQNETLITLKVFSINNKLNE